MMKKTVFLTLLCVLLLCFSGGVFADAAVYDWDVSRECSYDAYVSTVDGGVNLREEPTVAASILCTIPDFVCLHISRESTDGWGFTSYDGVSGWVALSQLSESYPVESVLMNVKVTAADGVNLREGPYTSYDKLLSSAIPRGEVLKVTGVSRNDWGEVTYQGITGWIALSQVKEVKANTSVPVDEDVNTEDMIEQQTAEGETVEQKTAEQEAASAEIVDKPESESAFPMAVLFVGLIIIVIVVSAVLIVMIVTKKK